MKTYLKYNNITVECFPKNALKLSYKKNTDEVFKRRELIDALIFVDDEANNHFDYSNIMNNVLCTEFIFYIPEKDFSASFFITECEIDEYRKTLTVTPITIDEYTPIDNIINEKVNVAAFNIPETLINLGQIGYKINTWSFKINDAILHFNNFGYIDRAIVSTENGYIYFDDGIYQPQGGGNFKPPVGTLTRLKRFVYTVKEYYDEFIFGSTIIQDVYRCDLSLTYATEILYTGDAPDNSWTIKEGDEVAGSYNIYHRPYGGSLTNPLPYSSHGYVVGEKYDCRLIYQQPTDLYNINVGSYPLLDFIKLYYLGNINIESQFFNSEVNPIASILGLKFSMKYLYVSIFQNFALDIAGIVGYEKQTIAEITLKSILDDLYSMFRIRWDIHNGNLRLEHEYFYENHYSYGATNNLIKQINKFNKYIYSYINQDINKGQKLGYTSFKTLDFGEYELVYKSGSVLCVHQLKESVSESIGLFCNDLNCIMYNWQDTRDNIGLVMLKADSNKRITYENSFDDGSILPNGFLSTFNCIKYFHIISGYYSKGVIKVKIVGEDTNFDVDIFKLKRIKLQKDVMINSYDFDLNYTYITPIGQGVVEEAEEDLDNGTVNLTLLYD